MQYYLNNGDNIDNAVSSLFQAPHADIQNKKQWAGIIPSSKSRVQQLNKSMSQRNTTPNPTSVETDIEILFRINKVLDCGLDRRTIEVLLDLIEAGVHPEALADVVADIRSPESFTKTVHS